MPAPTVATYSIAALYAANNGFKTLMDAATGAGSIEILSSADVVLAVIALTDPCGTVSAITGALTLYPDGREESAPATGTAAYAQIKDGDGDVHLALPCQAGTVAVAGKCVLSNLSIVAGDIVNVLGLVIG